MGTPRTVHVYRPDEPGPETPDTERRQQWVRDDRWAAWIRNDAGDVSNWHHHAANDTYVYVSRGSLTFEFGTGGAERVVASAGDFVIVPAQTIHRDQCQHSRRIPTRRPHRSPCHKPCSRALRPSR